MVISFKDEGRACAAVIDTTIEACPNRHRLELVTVTNPQAIAVTTAQASRKEPSAGAIWHCRCWRPDHRIARI